MLAGPSPSNNANAAAQFDHDNDSNESFPDIRDLWKMAAKKKRTPAGTSNNPPATAQAVPVQDPGMTGHEDRPEGQEQDVEMEDGENNEMFEIEKICSWRYASDGTHDVELLVEWEEGSRGPRTTWEAESEIQMTAGEVVWRYWESFDNITEGYARNRALGLGQDCNMYVPLRVIGHRWARAATKKNRWYTGGHRSRRQAAQTASQSARLDYQVEWVGYRTKTWEPARHIDRELLANYWAEHGATDENHGECS